MSKRAVEETITAPIQISTQQVVKTNQIEVAIGSFSSPSVFSLQPKVDRLEELPILTRKLKALYSSLNMLPKLIDDEKLPELSLSKYYIKLQVVLHEGEGKESAAANQVIGKKTSIEIENIFTAVGGACPAASKILILGGAGVGKTTLLHYMSYRWGEGLEPQIEKASGLSKISESMWGDRFDYVFKVRLKDLLDSGWKSDYTMSQRQDSLLSCFIHYCLKMQDSCQPEELQFNEKDLEAIIKVINQEKILLLLDGYDEIAHVATQARDCQNIMKAVFEHKHVIMSSRPNTLADNIKNKFDRKIESKGLDWQGVTKYIDLNFTKKAVDVQQIGEELKHFLTINYQLKGMCEVPMNTALLCLIWGDQEIREKFTENTQFSIGQLYNEVIIWLGKRYIAKNGSEKEREAIKNNNITDQQIFLIKELEFLKKVAFDAFIETGKLVTSKVMQSNLNIKASDGTKYNIEDINKFGLMQPDGEGKQIINLNQQFIYLTFQEYLTAYNLKEQLSEKEIEKVQDAAKFIAIHRSEPKYLMTLKFLSGIVSNEPGERQSQQLVTRFWEAVTCNVDGVLELGVETKVTLLMHLLEQGKVQGKIDKRIPNLETIEQLINEVVLSDISKWTRQIIDSGYLSANITTELKSIMQRNQEQQDNKVVLSELSLNFLFSPSTLMASSIRAQVTKHLPEQEQAKPLNLSYKLIKTAVDIVTSLSNKKELGGKVEILKQVLTLIKAKDWQLQKLGLEKLKQLIDITIDSNLLQQCAEIIIPLIKDNNLSKYAINSLAVIDKILPNVTSLLLNHLKDILDNEQASISLKKVTKYAISEIYKAMPTNETFEAIEDILTNKELDTLLKEVVIYVIPVTVKDMPFNMAVELLGHENKLIREVAQATISTKLQDSGEIASLDYSKIITALKIIEVTTDDLENKKLNLAAKKALEFILITIDTDVIKWLNEHFKNLSHSNETISFLRAIFHKTLSDGKINEVEAEFIIKCIIEKDLTSVIIPKDNKIIFEGTSYSIFRESTIKLEAIIEEVLRQSAGSLAKQYRDHKPLFINSGLVLKKSASDLEDISIIDGKPLVTNDWKLSVIYLSSHLKQQPTEGLIIVERRDASGYHIINKISIKTNLQGSEQASNISLLSMKTPNLIFAVKAYSIHPNILENESTDKTSLLKEIFGPMEYIRTKPRYYGTVSEISRFEGEEIINKANIATKEAIIEGSIYQLLNNFLLHSLKQDNVKSSLSLKDSWGEYVSQALNNTIQTFEKSSLLKIANEHV